VGIDLDAVTQQLEHEGVEKFVKAFDALMKTLKEKQSQTLKSSKIERSGV
jgi:transaldolase